MSDVETTNPQERQARLVSRALSALVVRMLVGCESDAAAACVIDGRKDQGIDAIGFGDGAPELFLIQAKWSDKGNAGIKASYVRDLISGFRQIEDQSFVRFNPKFGVLAGRVKALIQNPKVQVTLVLAMMGDGRIEEEVQDELDAASMYFNGHGRLLHHQVLTVSDFWQFIRSDMSPAPIELFVPMSRWLPRDGFADSYFGVVSVDNLARWYREHGDRLFEGNVRKALGLTAVNQKMIRTLREDPESFWAMNNGITILCSQIQRTRYYGSSARFDQPVDLTLQGAVVVNGAQTVHAAYRAGESNPDTVCRADVMVRVISVPAESGEIGRAITESTNTQNHIEPRDFIALDPIQGHIRDDFMLALNLVYVFQRGDGEPAREAGCSVVEAAVALACAHRNPALAVRTKTSMDTLWEQGRGGTYPQLFGNQPTALYIWRCVLLHRAVRDALAAEMKSLRERALSIAEYGNLLLAHMAFRLVEPDEIEDAEVDWDAVVGRVCAQVAALLLWLIAENDSTYRKSFISRTFTDESKCRALADRVLAHLRGEEVTPALPADYLPPQQSPKTRARTAVAVILDAVYLKQGTPLLYQPLNAREQAAMAEWIRSDPRRSRASWVVDRSRPILWEADGKQYSPTGLVLRMWEQAGWTEAPVAVQGTKSWYLADEGSLADIAAKLRRDPSEDD
ncbi:AIPR family protein [Nocardia sp. NPDC004168]|uniref:AIPR family protein n=1 Tax=Nocardia sp. NPDC004168 TaxID=3154452 RepID=UPI0033A78304